MIGAFLNGLGILLGALFGLAVRKPVAARTQAFFKSALGALTVFYGLRLMYESVRLINENVPGTFLTCLKQIFIAMLAVVLGNWIGRLLRLQTLSNRLGRQAATLLATAKKDPSAHHAAAFAAATILFCAAPLGILGAVADGLQNYCFLLLVKALMDGLAMMSFVKMFRWQVALAALPVFFFFNGLSLLVHRAALPLLETHNLIGFVGLATGLITCSVALVIFEVRRVELANYLPALALAPLLGHWLG